MKKFALTALFCAGLAFTGHAAESPLNESINENRAILESSKLQEAVPQNGFITELSRLTPEVNSFGKVFYKLVVRLPLRSDEEAPILAPSELFELQARRQHHHHHHHHSSSSDSSSHHGDHPCREKTVSYIVELRVKPNPDIGPHVIKVHSIRPFSRQSIQFFDCDDDSSAE